MDIGALPGGTTLARVTPSFDDTSVPAGLLREHRVANDVWGRVVVQSGTLVLCFDDDSGERHRVADGDTVVLAPGRLHHVEIDGPVSFAVEFHRVTEISPKLGYEKRYVDIDGMRMAYVEAGTGDPIVLLHGNPTSSYLWRNVIPHLETLGRCIAPDLIGMGDSAKLPTSNAGSYRFVEHRHYLDGLLDHLRVHRNVTLIVQDWGSGLGFDWAQRHPDAIAGIAYFEAIVGPRSWSQLSDGGRSTFRALRSEHGESMALDDNFFIERGLPGGVIRTLADEEMDEYRRPFLEPGEARRATLTWPREIPFDGEPADVHDITAAYAAWLASSVCPKLFINVSEGDTLTGELVEQCRRWPNQDEVSVTGRHFAQEDSPHEIGEAIADWIRRRDTA